MARYTQEERQAWARDEAAHWRALVAGVRATLDGDGWRRYLDAQARFAAYSPANVLLIVHQRPDATRVAGYRTWQQLGRQVRAGERGLRIWAPCVGRAAERQREDGEEEAPRVYFRTVPVFDISQTDGEPVPDATDFVTRLQGDGAAGLFVRLEAAAVSQGLTVERRGLGGPNGTYIRAQHRIEIEERLETNQAAKTLAHEIAHHVLGASRFAEARAEAEAESTAYLVCRRAGLDTSSYSLGYVSYWLTDLQQGGADGAARELAYSQDRIVAASRLITDWMD